MSALTTVSGVRWLEDLPETWRLLPAKALFQERKERSRGEDVHLTPSQRYGVLPQDEYMSVTGGRVVLNLAGAENMRHVEPGDFISHLRSFQGGLERSTTPGKVSAAYTVLSPRASHEGSFYRWLFKSTAYIQALGATTDQLRDGQSIRFGEFALVPLPHPPVAEQRAIADFLNRETAQIDEFIAENERFIELLIERRAAVIAHAVTKGLDPDAPLRDSGVEWLGGVPAAWEVAKLWYAHSVTLGKMLDESKFDASNGQILPYIRAANIQVAGLNIDQVNEMPFTAREAQRFSIRKGDLMVVEGGAVGVNVYIRKDMPGWGFQKTVNRVRPRHGASTKYLGYVLDVARARGFIDMLAAGSTIAHLTAEKLGGILVPHPPAKVQHEIANYLDKRTARIDEAVTTAREGIALAKERRSALISAAVTGKIDVVEGMA